MSWGFHGIYNVFRCAPATIRCPATILKFNKELVHRIDMKAYGKPYLERFGPTNKVLGYTLVQLIETSSITAHFVEETDDIYLDVFSCKPFENQDVKDVVWEFFKPDAIQSRFLLRQAMGRME